MGVWQRSPESRRIALANPANTASYDRALPGWKPSDVIGSPYAVAGYVPDPRIGTWDDLDRAREKLRARGIALFLDFVGKSHCAGSSVDAGTPGILRARDAKGFRERPSQLLSRGDREGSHLSALGRDPYFPPWKDTVQLNHFEPQMRAAQLADLRTIAQPLRRSALRYGDAPLERYFRPDLATLLCMESHRRKRNFGRMRMRPRQPSSC